MASAADTSLPSLPRTPAWNRDPADRALGVAAAAMALIVAVAVARGHADWGALPPSVWLHLALIGVALVLTPAMMLRGKGDRPHRVVGWVWVVAMMATALTSLAFNAQKGGHNWGVFSGDVSPIHLISLFVLVMVPRLVLNARAHRVAKHRRSARGLVIGAILVAGLFTFPFGRLLGQWLFA